MEFNQKHYKYSMRNIPTPSENLHRTTLIEKVEFLMKRMRRKANLFKRSEKRQLNPFHYVFKVENVCHNIRSLFFLKVIC